MRNFITIAIDGVAASGKTSTSLKLADKYSLLAFTTGICYRAITLKIIKENISCEDAASVREFLEKITLGTKILKENVVQMTINGECFEEKDLRSHEVNEHVAKYSSIFEIRSFLLDYQREQVEFAHKNGFRGLVMEGRDITSVILQNADLKFFLEANTKERSLRRKNDQEDDCIIERDKIDSKRTLCESGVYKIDTGIHNLDEVINIISQKIDKILHL